jgi:hypothetical protein
MVNFDHFLKEMEFVDRFQYCLYFIFENEDKNKINKWRNNVIIYKNFT